MTGIDWIILLVALIIIIVQTARGSKEMDIPLFEMIALLLTTWIALKTYSSIANFLPISKGVTLLIMFIVMAVILLYIAKLITTRLELTWEPFDAYLSFIFGVATAWIVLHFILRLILVATDPTSQIAVLIQNSPVAKEILEYNIFKAIGRFLNEVRLGE
ncbi:MAG: CvpA family protein [candidate division WOR-3 bacterium]|nr:CvpA family protein [candidate division WOR-3 bacterium]